MSEMSIKRAQIVIDRVNTDGRIKGDREELKAAAKVLSEAAGFRIGQKPQKVYNFNGLRLFPCPRCACMVTTDSNYCHNCGQALDRNDITI